MGYFLLPAECSVRRALTRNMMDSPPSRSACGIGITRPYDAAPAFVRQSRPEVVGSERMLHHPPDENDARNVRSAVDHPSMHVCLGSAPPQRLMERQSSMDSAQRASNRGYLSALVRMACTLRT